MKRCLLAFLFCFSFLLCSAAIITGTITNQNGQTLAFASVAVKGSNKGAVANGAGVYTLQLEPGRYTLVCRHVGYKLSEKEVEVGLANQQLSFVLAEQDLTMEEVVIKRGEDPALEIMRRTIRKRDFYNRQIDSFTVDVYIKGLMRSRRIPDKVFGQKVDKSDMQKNGIDSSGRGILFLSESLTKVAYKRPDKIKYEVISSRASGGGLGFDFPFFINFYTNNVQVFRGSLNPRGFVSPLADGAFRFYRFRFEGSFFDGGKMIDRIRVTPRRKHEPLFDGYLQIVDEEWRLHSVNLLATATQGLDLLDTVRITQQHAEVVKDVYKPESQVVSIAAGLFGFDVTGDFLNVYTNYNINPGFGKKFFNRILVKYDTAANKRDSSYWAALRPVPLEADERRDFLLKDSVAKADRDSLLTKKGRDSLAKNKSFSPQQLVFGGYSHRSLRPRTTISYRFNPFLPYGIDFNSVEGLSLAARQSLTIDPRLGKKTYTLFSDTRYGFSNGHLNSFATLTIAPKDKGFRQRYLRLTGGKMLQQLNRDNPIAPRIDALYTLLQRKNFRKLYESWKGAVEYNNRLENGLRLNLRADYEDRLPLENSSDFSLRKNGRELLPNHPFELAAVPFARHKALVTSVTVSFQPGQRYIQYPQAKMPIGSRYPTIELQYSKGLPSLLGSVANFDKWRLSVYDDKNLKLLGTFQYRISAGGFLNTKRVDIPDFTHFNGNQTFQNLNYLNSFQLAPYYRYSNTERLYGLVHVEHHFNGLLTNKIPLLNKWKWHLVAGTNAFYVNRNNYYVEGFVGLENIFKVLRVDVVTAWQTAAGSPVGVRLGFGGVIGDAMRSALRNR